MIRKLFSEGALQHDFDIHGYVVIDILEESTIKIFKDHYNKRVRNDPKTFSTTLDSSDKKYKVDINNFIKSIIQSKLEKVLLDYEVLYSSYIVKKPSLFRGKVGFHADWQFVDEEKYSSVNIWIALQDTNCFNGSLKVIPGSHKKIKQLRGPNYNIKMPSEKICSTNLYLKKGQAIIYDSRLIHASSKNISLSKRVIVSALMIPVEANPLYIYFSHLEHSDPPKINEVDKKFYIENCIFTKCNGYWLESL